MTPEVEENRRFLQHQLLELQRFQKMVGDHPLMGSLTASRIAEIQRELGLGAKCQSEQGIWRDRDREELHFTSEPRNLFPNCRKLPERERVLPPLRG